MQPVQVGLKKWPCLTFWSWWQRRGGGMSEEDMSTRYPAQVTTQLNGKEWVTTHFTYMVLYDTQPRFAWKCEWGKTGYVTVFQDNLAKAWITLKHVDTYPCCICSQDNEEFFEFGAIAQVIKNNVDDVNCIGSVSRLQYHVSYLLWRESWQDLHLCWE